VTETFREGLPSSLKQNHPKAVDRQRKREAAMKTARYRAVVSELSDCFWLTVWFDLGRESLNRWDAQVESTSDCESLLSEPRGGFMFAIRLYLAALVLIFLVSVVMTRDIGVLESTVTISALLYLILDARADLRDLKLLEAKVASLPSC
jgi:hypothetical protein